PPPSATPLATRGGFLLRREFPGINLGPSRHIVLKGDDVATQTTQATGKLWKLAQLVGMLTFFGSIVRGIMNGSSATTAEETGSSIAGAILLGTLGLTVWIVGRIGAWWFHR